MQFSEVKQVKQVIGAGKANDLLNDGWVLLAVVSASVTSGTSAVYVFGKSTSPEKDRRRLTIEYLQNEQGL